MVQMLNPANHSLDEKQAKQYLTEPYYLDGDVYANPDQYARGGWSIYTGAAGWYFRCILETLLGFAFSGDFITISPRVPDEWDQWSAELVYRGTKLHVSARRAERNAILDQGVECKKIFCDGGEEEIELLYN